MIWKVFYSSNYHSTGKNAFQNSMLTYRRSCFFLNQCGTPNTRAMKLPLLHTNSFNSNSYLCIDFVFRVYKASFFDISPKDLFNVCISTIYTRLPLKPFLSREKFFSRFRSLLFLCLFVLQILLQCMMDAHFLIRLALSILLSLRLISSPCSLFISNHRFGVRFIFLFDFTHYGWKRRRSCLKDHQLKTNSVSKYKQHFYFNLKIV